MFDLFGNTVLPQIKVGIVIIYLCKRGRLFVLTQKRPLFEKLLAENCALLDLLLIFVVVIAIICCCDCFKLSKRFIILSNCEAARFACLWMPVTLAPSPFTANYIFLPKTGFILSGMRKDSKFIYH